MSVIETWLPVVGYEDCYAVSDAGRVWGWGALAGSGRKRGCYLKARRDKGGYEYVGLNRKRTVRNCAVARLVMAAFVGRCPSGMEVNHIDCDTSNNALGNLEYVTHAENMAHARRHGRMVCVNRKLTTEQVSEIRRLRQTRTAKIRDLAELYGVSTSTICSAQTGKSYRDVDVAVVVGPRENGWRKPPRVRTGHLRGSAHGMARLSEAQVRAIRAEWERGGTPTRLLAFDYGVSEGAITGIVGGRTWKHLLTGAGRGA